MQVAQEVALDRLDLARQSALDEISRLRCERAQICIDQSDQDELREAVRDIHYEIVEAEDLLKAIDQAAGDVRRIELKSVESVQERQAA